MPSRRRSCGWFLTYIRAVAATAAIRSAGALALLIAVLPAAAEPSIPAGRLPDRAPIALGDSEAEPAWAESVPTTPGQPASTRRMALLIQRIHREADPMGNAFRSTDQIPLLREAVAQAEPGKRKEELQYTLARQLLQSGLPEEALKEFDALERLATRAGAPLDVRSFTLLRTSKAVCHLRIGEQENCLLNHNADSCLLPIAGGGVHQLQRGSRAAVEELMQVLRRAPSDMRARWLLNIAYMTLGEYPDKVPPLWVIDPQAFASDYDPGRFPDVAPHAGLAVNALAGGVILEDFDHDELLDVMITAWGFSPANQMRVFRNNGDGTFTERTREAGLLGLVSGLNILQGDYDNDGHVDVLVLRGAWLGRAGHYPLSLLRNNGDFTFTDVTEAAGLLRFHPTQAATWFDYDGDGRLDIFVANESTQRDTHPCELFHNNGDGTFTERARECGVAFVGFFKGAVSDDFNNDGRPDLYLSRRDGANHLVRNDGPADPAAPAGSAWRFTDVAARAGVEEPKASFPCWFFDYDNDGWSDIAATGYWIEDVGDVATEVIGLPSRAARTRLYRNNRDGTFTDVSREAGVHRVLHAMSANFGDLDTDGWLDFYLGTGDPDLATIIPNRMFRNDGGRRFQDVTTSGGFGQVQKGHGIAFGDLDNDGDQDIYSVVGGAVEADYYPNQLFANPGHGHHWLKLRLEGVRTNRSAIGARVRVVVADGASERVIHRTICSGASFGASTLRAEIGLGTAREIRRVEVLWPVTGATQVLTGLEADGAYLVREGAPAAEPIQLMAFQLPRSEGLGGSQGRAHGGRNPPVEWCAPASVR